MGSQRVRHDSATFTFSLTYSCHQIRTITQFSLPDSSSVDFHQCYNLLSWSGLNLDFSVSIVGNPHPSSTYPALSPSQLSVLPWRYHWLGCHCASVPAGLLSWVSSSSLIVSNSHLLCPWYFCWFPHVVCVSCSILSLCNSVDCSPPDSSVHEVFQARILQWVAISWVEYYFFYVPVHLVQALVCLCASQVAEW